MKEYALIECAIPETGRADYSTLSSPARRSHDTFPQIIVGPPDERLAFAAVMTVFNHPSSSRL